MEVKEALFEQSAATMNGGMGEYWMDNAYRYHYPAIVHEEEERVRDGIVPPEAVTEKDFEEVKTAVAAESVTGACQL